MDKNEGAKNLTMTSVLFLMVMAVVSFWAIEPRAQQPSQFPSKINPYPVVADITFAEGPTFDSKGNLYFVNYVRYGTIGRKTPDGTVDVWIDLDRTGGSANGLKADKNDNIVVADPKGKRLLRVSPERKITVLADRFDDKPLLGPNDIALDQAGNIFFTDPSGSSRENPIGGVYRYSTERKLTRLDQSLAFPNGLAVSPDQKRLYVAEMLASRILVYDLSADGSASNRRLLYQFPPGNLDGIGFDEYSRLWVTRPEQNVVDVLTEKGELAGSIPTGKTVTNLAWWGKSVYLTIAGEHSIHRLDLGIGSAR